MFEDGMVEIGKSDLLWLPFNLDLISCPINREIISDPVTASDGYTYERASIIRWMHQNTHSPVTSEPMSSTALFPNHSIKRLIDLYFSQKQAENALAAAPSAAAESPAADGAEGASLTFEEAKLTPGYSSDTDRSETDAGLSALIKRAVAEVEEEGRAAASEGAAGGIPADAPGGLKQLRETVAQREVSVEAAAAEVEAAQRALEEAKAISGQLEPRYLSDADESDADESDTDESDTEVPLDVLLARAVAEVKEQELTAVAKEARKKLEQAKAKLERAKARLEKHERVATDKRQGELPASASPGFWATQGKNNSSCDLVAGLSASNSPKPNNDELRL